MNIVDKKNKRFKRKHSVRKNIVGTDTRPRVSVFRSNKSISAQIINDVLHHTLVGMADVVVKNRDAKKIEKAKLLGIEIAKVAQAKKISQVVFDRNGYRYHGRVKALADGLREGGLIL